MTPRNVIVMAVLAILCGLAWYALKDTETGPPRLPATWPEFSKDQVTRIVLTSQGQTQIVRRRVERTDSWEIEVGAAAARADASVVSDLLTQIARQEVRSKIARDQVTDADVGLGAPTTTVELTVPGGTVPIRYGRKTREGSVYVDSGPGTDVWVVGGTVPDQVFTCVEGGLRAKHMTDVRQAYDVSKVEIVKGGVTTIEAEVDTAGIWRIRQPFRGYAEPQKFADWLSKLVHTQVSEWAELGAVDLQKYGLATPQAEVVLHPKRQAEPATILVGAPTADGAGVFTLEKGYPNVAAVPRRFLEAVLTDPMSLRDRSFSRIGIGERAVTVSAGEVAYELRKEGSGWDIVKPQPTLPGDDTAIRDALKLVREWHTHEFLDAAKPEDHGIDGKTTIEIEREGGGKTLLSFGALASEGKRYARRKDEDGEGGVEVVDAAPLDLLLKGYPQFRRKSIGPGTTWIEEIERVARERGRADDAAAIQTIAVERKLDLPNPKWEVTGPGHTGVLDPAALNEILVRLTSLVVRDWVFWKPALDEEYGFYAPEVAETLSIRVLFSNRTGEVPGGKDQLLMIGKKRPEGGYFARMTSQSGWVFVLSEEDVAAFSRALTKTEPPLKEEPPKEEPPKEEPPKKE